MNANNNNANLPPPPKTNRNPILDMQIRIKNDTTKRIESAQDFLKGDIQLIAFFLDTYNKREVSQTPTKRARTGE